MIGNSSSGILEAPLLGTPSINFGKRQTGRIKSLLTVNCKLGSKKGIVQIKKFLKQDKKRIYIKKNPYYGTNVSKKIYLKLKKLDFKQKNYKMFNDINFRWRK